MMSSIVFSFTALESFANELILDDIQYKEERDTGIIVIREKAWVERNISLSYKFSQILPQTVGVPSPKGTKIWTDFVALKRLRNRIIHMKTIDRDTIKDENFSPESLWSDLTNPEVIDFPNSTKALMEHFYPDDFPHWLKHCPF